MAGIGNKNLELLNRLKSEGFIVFTQEVDDIVDYLDNNLRHCFLTKEGKLITGENCELLCGKRWEEIVKLVPKGKFTRKELEFFKKYNLVNNWFRVTCLRELGMIWLNNREFNRLKEELKDE